MLAEAGQKWPPILVDRRTMRVIDGMHRLRAAQLRGDEGIEVKFFDGTAAAAFVCSVEANTAHGLPLSLADRRAAATRIVGSHPQWSDRVVGKIAGLSDKVVAAIRRSTSEDPQLNGRTGLDGRVRPLNCAEGRRIASQIISSRPDAPLRQVAQEAGISPATVRDVRERLRRGEDPVPDAQRLERRKVVHDQAGTGRRQHASGLVDQAAILRSLQRDPSLRFTDSGKSLLRWLTAHAVRIEDCDELIGSIPPHGASLVIALARSWAETWHQFAEQLEQYSRTTA
jgi:ParB-like chromosome segregation protein Spo0J